MARFRPKNSTPEPPGGEPRPSTAAPSLAPPARGGSPPPGAPGAGAGGAMPRPAPALGAPVLGAPPVAALGGPVLGAPATTPARPVPGAPFAAPGVGGGAADLAPPAPAAGDPMAASSAFASRLAVVDGEPSIGRDRHDGSGQAVRVDERAEGRRGGGPDGARRLDGRERPGRPGREHDRRHRPCATARPTCTSNRSTSGSGCGSASTARSSRRSRSRSPSTWRLVSRIKIMSGMNIVERRRPQDGQFSTVIDGKPVDVRVASVPRCSARRSCSGCSTRAGR